MWENARVTHREEGGRERDSAWRPMTCEIVEEKCLKVCRELATPTTTMTPTTITTPTSSNSFDPRTSC